MDGETLGIYLSLTTSGVISEGAAVEYAAAADGTITETTAATTPFVGVVPNGTATADRARVCALGICRALTQAAFVKATTHMLMGFANGRLGVHAVGVGNLLVGVWLPDDDDEVATIGAADQFARVLITGAGLGTT